VTAGVRAVLQYDILVSECKFGYFPFTSRNESKIVESEVEDDSEVEESCGVEEDLQEEEESSDDQSDGDVTSRFYSENCSCVNNPSECKEKAVTCCLALSKIMVLLLKEVTATSSIALPLFHLYRQQALLPEYLKGADETLYLSLVPTFDIKLVPIIITNRSGYDGDWKDYRVNTAHDVVGDARVRTESSAENSVKVVYIATGLEQLIDLECVEFIEHTGNEAQEGYEKYFTGAMVISRGKVKSSAEASCV
jgi:hypothetical protein